MNPFLPKTPVGPLHSHSALQRYDKNPIFTAKDVPYPSNLAFNAGVALFEGKYYMAFRNDVFKPDNRYALKHSASGLAVSDDGLNWQAFPEEINFHYKGEQLLWVNDARLTVLDGDLYLSFCFNSKHGERPGFACWRGGSDFDVVYLGVPAQRNMILCPDKIDGRYWRLERPATRRAVYDMWISFSPDLRHWGDPELLLGVEDVPFATQKIGGGPPPIRTEHGYLTLFHAVDNDPVRMITYPNGSNWDSRYSVGAILLDLQNPQKVTAITKQPLLVAETDYETGDMEKFWREDVVFPCGAILEEQNLLRIYYGAGDYSTCLAFMKLDDLLDAMVPYKRMFDYATISPEGYV
jgi:beta-1,4-mannooligosaccharide/beta-1,4-mannosyl-N-acetylglucosamine phosphorylase